MIIFGYAETPATGGPRHSEIEKEIESKSVGKEELTSEESEVLESTRTRSQGIRPRCSYSAKFESPGKYF